jgi:transposase
VEKGYGELGGNSFRGRDKPRMTVEEKRMCLLQKRIRDAELGRDTLKKAIGILSASDGKYTGP